MSSDQRHRPSLRLSQSPSPSQRLGLRHGLSSSQILSETEPGPEVEFEPEPEPEPEPGFESESELESELEHHGPQGDQRRRR